MFHLIITAIDKVFFDGQVRSLNCKGVSGEMTILARHAPLVTMLKEGVLKIETGSERKEISVKSGFLAVHKDETIILVS